VDAIEEHNSSGDVWVRTSLAGSFIAIEITDSGRGVKNASKIFDPFFTTKAVGKGTGLGLSICYGIIKEHAGEIQVRNSPPRGATFLIRLPVSQAAVQGEVAIQAPEAASGRVLIVDDEEDVLQLEREILQSHGLTVRTAANAAEAIEVLKQSPVDAVVADMKMPGEVSTLELYGWIANNRPDLATHVAFTSSDHTASDVASRLQSAGCHIVSKPFRIEDFWAAAQRLLHADATVGASR
jgi:CheY-like chemotaxis protein